MPVHHAYLRQLRAAHPVALRELRRLLVEHGGHVPAAAAEVGCSERGLREAIKATEQGQRILARHGFGRQAAAQNARNSVGSD